MCVKHIKTHLKTFKNVAVKKPRGHHVSKHLARHIGVTNSGIEGLCERVGYSLLRLLTN